jgi:arginase
MKVKLIGIPCNSGGLYSGTESTPSHLRQLGLKELLEKNNITVEDCGDISLPSFIPSHSIAPIRNWPSPRIVWDEMFQNSKLWTKSEGFSLILGGDCSMVTGAVRNFYEAYDENLYLLCLDAHLDALEPSPEVCVGAAAMGLWFLCNENMFFKKLDKFNGANISVIGTQQEYEHTYGVSLTSYDELKSLGIDKVVKEYLNSLPKSAKIFIHLDLDVICKDELSAVYAPSVKGLSIEEVEKLLSLVLVDERTIGMEVAEFSTIKDVQGIDGEKVNKMLTNILKARQRNYTKV